MSLPFDVEGEAQPVNCYFSLEIKSGTLQIVKTSEDGEVSGIPSTSPAMEWNGMW